MSRRCAEDFEAPLSEVGIFPTRLSSSEAAEAFAAMEEFAVPGTRPLWERKTNALSRRDPDGWKRIASIASGPQLLLFDECAYRFETPEALVEAVGESYLSVFYLTDPDKTYLISFNDHDYLGVVGHDELKRRLVASYQASPGDFDNPDDVSLGSSESGEFIFGFPDDWTRIEERTLRVLKSSTPESRQLQMLLRKAKADGGVERSALVLAVHRLVDAHEEVSDAAEFVLLFSRFLPLRLDPEFFGARPGLWPRCGELAALDPLGFNNANRILYHDLHYNHYLNKSVECYDEGGIEAVVELFERTEFFRTSSMGREVVGRVRHKLRELRLGEKSGELALIT